VDLVPHVDLTHHSKNREIYIDVFRGLMALVMVQGHLFDALVLPDLRTHGLYHLQHLFHGSTAPGFLFASGFVAGLPRAPLSLKASLRRARRLLFVLGVGYALHLPFFSLFKVLREATPAETAALFACDALQVIAVTQLAVLALQWIAGRWWIQGAAWLTVAILAAGPFVWASGVSSRLPLALGSFLDETTGSRFPVFPFSAFVLAGVVAGAGIGRREPKSRKGRALGWGFGLLGGGLALAPILSGHVDFWGVSPAYAVMRLGGLILLLRAMDSLARRDVPGTGPLALLGHETLQVYVLHLVLLYGGVVFGAGLLTPLFGALTPGLAGLVLLAMIPILLLCSHAWHRVKARRPHEATLILLFLSTAFIWEFLTRPW
jgi:fucose 4-O-acetylase-like acetyltransferase